MAVALETRTTVAGAELQLLVLAAGRGACIGVDMASGAFVLTRWAGRDAPALHAFDVASARVSYGGADPLGRPEAVCVERPPHAVGRVRRRVAERYLRPLVLPSSEHPLGFPGPTVPYWMLAESAEGRDRPSVCLVSPGASGGASISAVRSEMGVSCRFTWRGVSQELPMADGALALLPVMNRTGRRVLSGAPLADVIGFVPRRLMVTLSPPRAGVCHKVVPALLP